MPAILQLPPLILHPFSGTGTDDLVEGSLAELALQGIVASTDDEAVLQRRILEARYQEVRMLLFLGKDLFRWMQQCVEYQSSKRTADARIIVQSFAALIVEDPPGHVKGKLESWGVSDRRTIFSRAVGVHSLFHNPPPLDSLSPVFLKNYHKYADHAYICFQHLKAFLPLDSELFRFEIYASAEYAQMLSKEWEQSDKMWPV